MAGAEALTLRYRQTLAKSTDVVLKEVARRLRQFDPTDLDAWWAAHALEIEGAVADGFDVSAKIAARYLADHGRAAGVRVTPVLAEPVPEQIATSLRVTGPVAYRRQLAISGSEVAAERVMIQSVTGSARRLVLGGARNTTDLTVAQSKVIVGWQRRTSGNPCAFCAMLASRGAVYKADTAGVDEQWHDHCSCTAEPVYRRTSARPPFAAEWQQAKELAASTGTRTDVAFRQIVEGRVPTGD